MRNIHSHPEAAAVTDDSLYVSHIRIKNILGIESLEIRPGKFTTISGGNGEGKSSALEAIKSTLKGGHDATLLRNGAERGHSVIVLDDGMQISKNITAEQSTQRVVDGNGEKVARHGEALRELVDALSVNPIEFLNAPKKLQVPMLLEAMPLKADVSELAKISGRTVAPELAEAHAMIAIETVRSEVFEARADTNRAIKEKKGTIAQLEAAIPEKLADLDAVDETMLEATLSAVDSSRDVELQRIGAKLAGMEDIWQAGIDDLMRQISALQEQINAVKQEREVTRGKAEKQRSLTRERCAAERKPVEERLAIIRSNREAAAKARVTRETVDRMKEELSGLEDDSTKATAALDGIEKYRADLLKNIPIPGLAVRDGDIYYGDVRFERLNTAGRMTVAAEVAKLRAGRLKLVCVDGIEALNEESFAAFKAAAKGSGVQFVVTRVGEGPLKVETEG